jgi:hypothetical protein
MKQSWMVLKRHRGARLPNAMPLKRPAPSPVTRHPPSLYRAHGDLNKTKAAFGT